MNIMNEIFDANIKWALDMYFTPHWLIGNSDRIKDLAVATLDGFMTVDWFNPNH